MYEYSDGRAASPAPQPATDGEIARWASELQEVGRLFYDRGWSLGTSSNYSVVLQREPLRLLITASGRDKRRMTDRDFVVVDESGRPLDSRMPLPSAETLLHVVTTQQGGVGSVLHTHSVWATVLSDALFTQGFVDIAGYEMLKGLSGITTHDCRVCLEIFDNSQDIPDLAGRVGDRFSDADNPLRFGFLIRGHGLYTWGRDLDEARRHVEILEFLLEVRGRRPQVGAASRGDGVVPAPTTDEEV